MEPELKGNKSHIEREILCFSLPLSNWVLKLLIGCEGMFKKALHIIQGKRLNHFILKCVLNLFFISDFESIKVWVTVGMLCEMCMVRLDSMGHCHSRLCVHLLKLSKVYVEQTKLLTYTELFYNILLKNGLQTEAQYREFK